jgi:Protein of unknown function (DUF3108)
VRVRASYPEGQERSGCRLKIWHLLPFLSFLILLRLLLPVSPALAASKIIEDLHYQVAALVWKDAAQMRVTLTKQGQSRLVAEVLGETRGFVKLLSGNHKERLQTEMVWREGRLVPLVYREESWQHGKRAFKEYRFDYPRARLSLWEWHKGKGLVKKWETHLQEQVYDPLSAFYNCRLKILGPNREGEASTIPGIPYPQPESVEIRLGPETVEGRQAMVSLVNPVFEGTRGVVFAMIDKQRVPQRVWTTAFGITITGIILPESVIMAAGQPALPASAPLNAPRPHNEAPAPTTVKGNSP